jgi:hypothetical protein
VSIHLTIPAPRAGLARCRCGATARHVAILGRGNPHQRIGDPAGHGVRHKIECCRCRRATPEQRSLFQAESVWGRPFQQRRLPLITERAA